MLDQRFEQLTVWLKSRIPRGHYEIAPASSDASFRRYFRVSFHDETRIAMDVPPQQESCHKFVKVAEQLQSLGLNVPRIYDQDLVNGFLLVSDLGSISYLAALSCETAGSMYADAMRSLLSLQAGKAQLEGQLPVYDRALLLREVTIFDEWFVQRHLGLCLSDNQQQIFSDVCHQLVDAALQQPQVPVHRDYHSRNLMIGSIDNPGILDFQDAVIGPITYDLVSLLKDCYINWPASDIDRWLNQFRNDLASSGMDVPPDPQTFRRWFDWMGAQRHLKAIGIFARLFHRDHKAGYLKDIPRTLTYLEDVANTYEELSAFSSLLHETILPRYYERYTS